MDSLKDCKHFENCPVRMSLGECLPDCEHYKSRDIVHVVRCKECKHCTEAFDGNPCCGRLRTSFPYVRDEDFCSYGEKKVNLEDIVDLDAQTKANNEAMRKVIAFMAGERNDNERKAD